MIPPSTRPVLFLSPGAGLGHLTRAAALATELHPRGIPCGIITSSGFAEAFERLLGIPIYRVPLKTWQADIPNVLKQLNPKALIVDSFPFGIRGELAQLNNCPECPMIYLARHLNLAAYSDAITGGLDAPPANLNHVLQIEPLSDSHQNLLQDWGVPVTTLPGPVRLNEACIPTTTPVDLETLLATGTLHLVVHSGPEPEVSELLSAAQANLADGDTIALVSPKAPRADIPTFDFFPAARLYPKARHIYTGAGYNSMAETAGFKDKHTVIAFPRRYDDQYARTQFTIPNQSGTLAAVELCSLG